MMAVPSAGPQMVTSVLPVASSNCGPSSRYAGANQPEIITLTSPANDAVQPSNASVTQSARVLTLHLWIVTALPYLNRLTQPGHASSQDARHDVGRLRGIARVVGATANLTPSCEGWGFTARTFVKACAWVARAAKAPCPRVSRHRLCRFAGAISHGPVTGRTSRSGWRTSAKRAASAQTSPIFRRLLFEQRSPPVRQDVTRASVHALAAIRRLF